MCERALAVEAALAEQEATHAFEGQLTLHSQYSSARHYSWQGEPVQGREMLTP